MPRRASQVAKETSRYAAEEMNLDLKHLQKIEAGLINVTMVTLVRIAQGFEESMASLFATSRKKQSNVGLGRQ
jgi:transcriptional regulator with XRE-family HTH domain